MSSEKPTIDALRIDRSDAPAPRSRSGLLGAGIVVLMVVVFMFWWLNRSKAIEVRTAAAQQAGSATADHTVLNASGYVTARRRATVSSKVTGKIVEVLIEEGLKVKAGQVLARLDDTNVRASLELAQAQLESSKTAVDETRALLKQADQEYHRVIELEKQKVSSPSELDRAESDARSLQARLSRQERDITVSERTVATWQQQMDDMIIRAPFDGVVTTKDAQPGEMISPVSAGGGFTRTGIGTIVDMSSLEIEIDVNESYIKRVESGQPVEATLDAYPEWKIPCKVIAIIPTADRQKSTVKVRIGFDQLDPRILPEMAAKVAFRDTAVATTDHSVIIPKSSVRSQDGRDIVYVLQSAHAERRAVTVARAEDDKAILSAGVMAGEKVIVDSPAGLADGVPVKEQ